MPNYHRYTELEVWKQGRELASNIYELTASYPKYEQFGLTSQMRRSVVSVPSNILILRKAVADNIKKKRCIFYPYPGVRCSN
jgi:hypothetical protein